MKHLLILTCSVFSLCLLAGCGKDGDGDDLIDAQDSREKASRALGEVSDELETMEESLRGLREQLNEKDKRITELSERVEKLEGENERLETELAKYKPPEDPDAVNETVKETE